MTSFLTWVSLSSGSGIIGSMFDSEYQSEIRVAQAKIHAAIAYELVLVQHAWNSIQKGSSAGPTNQQTTGVQALIHIYIYICVLGF